MEKTRCVFCKKEIEDTGNNPAPLRDKGRCCDECNGKVIFARFIAAKNRRQA